MCKKKAEIGDRRKAGRGIDGSYGGRQLEYWLENWSRSDIRAHQQQQGSSGRTVIINNWLRQLTSTKAATGFNIDFNSQQQQEIFIFFIFHKIFLTLPSQEGLAFEISLL